MSGAPAWFSILRCPQCHQSLEFTEARGRPAGAAEFGVLRCGCARYPVVDGIPILQQGSVGMFEHTTGSAEVEGIPAVELVALIERGATSDALAECLAVPELPPWLKRVLPWRVTNGAAGHRFARALGLRRTRRELLDRRSVLTARELLAFFYQPGRALNPAVGQYFLLRFGQPRHVAALALAERLPAAAKPVLDLACGTGHLAHYLTRRTASVPVIGMDMNFFHVWIARHWLAPLGQYVCANTTHALPFADDVFSAALCSDAWHYLPARAEVIREMQRCAPDRPIILTRVGNRSVMPNEGAELDLPGYRAEFASASEAHASERDHCWSEHALLRAYLRREDPLAAEPERPESLHETKWFSFVLNEDALVRSHAVDVTDAGFPGGPEWPHAAGRLGLNPIYRPSRAAADGSVRLRFEFPGTWYAYENHAMLAYHPRTVRLLGEHWAALQTGRISSGDAAMASLVRDFVVIGLPERL